MNKSALVEHIEKYLGVILHGWSVDIDGNEVEFQVVELKEKWPGIKCYSTLGLSKYSLPSRMSEKLVRCELVMLARDGSSGSIPSVLQQIGREIIRKNSALLRGDVIGPRSPIVSGSAMEALYASIPVYFPDAFATCESCNGPIVFIWLIPVSHAEAAFIRKRGWDAFEERLANIDPDLSDLFRQPIIPN